MSNFQFLEPEFKSLAVTAKEAEKLVYISPQFALAAARTSLENLVLWLYQQDKKLTQPYDASLHNLLNDLKFKDLIPPYIWDKMDNIRMVGNSAVHGKKFKQLTTEETVKHISHLFLMYVWFKGEKKHFYEVATHRIGNLVIDSISANSSKGHYDFSDKLEALSTNSTFLSQGELTKYSLKDDEMYQWTLDSIKERQEKLITFIKETWNPEKYYQSVDSIEEDESQGMVGDSEVV